MGMDGRKDVQTTCAKIVITTGCDCGSVSWIKTAIIMIGRFYIAGHKNRIITEYGKTQFFDPTLCYRGSIRKRANARSQLGVQGEIAQGSDEAQETEQPSSCRDFLQVLGLRCHGPHGEWNVIHIEDQILSCWQSSCVYIYQVLVAKHCP